MKRYQIMTILKKLFASLIIILLFLVLIQTDSKNIVSKIRNNKLNVTQWSGNLNNVYDIKNYENSSNVMDYVYFNNFLANLSIYKEIDINKFTVVIEKESDLQYITMLMNAVPTGISIPAYSPSWYLSLNYVLGNNINLTGQNIYPIGTSINPFTGVFDGQGFRLQNMHLKQIDVNDYSKYYSYNNNDYLEYYSLFSYLGENAIVRNLILVDPQASQIYSIENKILFASPLAGVNSGTIENCSVINESVNSLIFRVSMDFVVSSMVSKNTTTGVIKNSFVGVKNNTFEGETSGRILPVYPVIYQNEGSIINVYYDAEKFIPEMSDFNQEIKEVLRTVDFQNPSLFATEFVNNWYFNNSYSNLTLTDVYPVLIGLRLYNGSIDTYKITKATDLIVFSKLIDFSSIMASRNFILTNCIDMKSVSSNIYIASKSIFNGIFSSEIATEACNHNHDISDATIKYHSIWNLTTSYASKGDTTSYSLLNELGGTIKNINLVNYKSSLLDASSYKGNIIHTGAIAGKVFASGIINNVNVYGSITLPDNSSSSIYGEIHIGGLVGINSGTISNSSFSGQINGGALYNGGNIVSTNGIGGIVGLSNGGYYENLKNNGRIIGISFKDNYASTNTSNTTYIGGIIGSGNYISLKKVVNNGLIISHDNQNGYLANTYIGGIISILTNTSSITDKTVNSGEIRLMIKDTSYIRNYFTAGFGTLSTDSTTQVQLTNITNSGKIQIATSFSLSNGMYSFTEDFYNYNTLLRTSGGLTVNPSGSTNIGGAIKITGVIIIDANTAANLNGVFQTANQTIDLGILYRYAPVIYSLNESTSYLIEVTKAYNTGNLNFITTRPMYNQKVSITGNTYGDYIFFDQIRNEGNMNIDITFASVNTFALNSNQQNTDYSSNFRISGLIGTLNNYNSTKGYYIYNSYNGGNITIKNYTNNTQSTLLSSTNVTSKTQTLQYMLYIGGIAFKNNNTLDIEPINNVIISSSRKGAIHNVLNDGDITVDLNLYGVSRVGGVTSLNSGLISSSFNTGNIHNYVALDLTPGADMSNNQFEVEAGGITCMITADTGQIMDSANYGDIICVSPKTGGGGWLNAGGIVGRNEKRENNTGNASVNWKAKIQFCVNYGNIYAWNSYKENFGEFLNTGAGTAYIGAESSCKAAGIMAIGVINVINCVNYGNVYSRYLAGGIFGLVDGTKFTGITSSIYIANSINYGEVRPITSFTKDSTLGRSQFTTAINVPATRNVYVNGYNHKINSMYGGAIGYIYAHSSWSRDGLGTNAGSGAYWNESNVSMLSSLLISFLINFDEQTNIIGSQSLYASSTALSEVQLEKYSKMVKYMANTKTTDTSMYPFNSARFNASYGGITYSVPEYSLSTNSGGIFASDFPLRGGNLDKSIITNEYIRNYISFVNYDYTNKDLVNKLFDTTKRIGIYAVASSKGILNGKYIPDNITWGSKSEVGLDPIENGEVNTSWRGLVTDTSSINYKFTKGMKQLSSSIATTVYDLELVNVNNSSIKIDAPIIDNENKIITFYVGDNEQKEGSGSLIQNKIVLSNPVINQAEKTITYKYNNQDLIVYNYSSGQLVRIDSNNLYLNPLNIVTEYKTISSYISGTITNYYINTGVNTYRSATNSDKLFTIEELSSGGTRYNRSTNQGLYTYTYNTYGRYRITATELTNRSTSGPYYYASSTGSTPNYIGIGSTVTSNYVLYEKINYPTSIEVIYKNPNSSYYDNLFTINTAIGSYNLAEGAYIYNSLDVFDNMAASNVRLGIPSIIDAEMYTSSINTLGKSQYLNIRSEAGINTAYEIRIVRINGKGLADVNVKVNDGTSQTNSSGSITLSSNLTKTTTQTLDITFRTINIPDKQNLLIETTLQKLVSSTYQNYNNFTENGDEIYNITGGIVNNKTAVYDPTIGDYVSAKPVNGVYPDASVAFKLVFGDYISAGTYRMVIKIGSVSYYIQFTINSSSTASVEEFTYNTNFIGGSGTWINSDNTTQLLTTVRFDTNIISWLNAIATTTPQNWTNINLPTNSYLNSLKISPYSTLVSIDVDSNTTARSIASTITSLGGSNYLNDSNGSKAYIITYNISSENGVNRTFKHYIVEALLDTNIKYVYMDGINQGQISSLSFVRTNKPTIKIFYDFEGIDYSNVLNFNTSITYNYDTTKYPKPTNGENQLIIDSILSIDVSSTGVTIVFTNDVACNYTFTVTYTRQLESSQIVTYQVFNISKTNNTDSSLVRVLFNTESPFTSLGTIIYNGYEVGSSSDPTTYVPESTATTNQELLNSNIYNILNSNDNLKIIKSMPNMIYYNGQKPKVLLDPNNSSIVYNRYDVVGFVSKTDLSNFIPTFTIPTGAIIYQLDENNQPIVNNENKPILSANFINEGGENNFNYIHYRIYSEASGIDANGFSIPNQQNNNFTDYYIYILDVSYNVYFNINFEYADSQILNELSTNEDNALLSLYRYEELTVDNKSTPADEISIISNLYYFFTKENNQPIVTTYNHVLSATASGYFILNLNLPKEYTYSFKFSGDSENVIYTKSDKFNAPAKLFAYRYTLTITISRLENGNWGQNGNTNLDDFYN